MIRSLAGVCLALSCAALGQDTATQPAFEVASVKPSDPQTRIIGLFTYPGGRITATNYTLKMLIHEAYAIDDYKILGGPRWTETDHYNLEAQPATSSKLRTWVPANVKAPPNPEMRQMAQTSGRHREKRCWHRRSILGQK